jgi:hypothetical protein
VDCELHLRNRFFPDVSVPLFVFTFVFVGAKVTVRAKANAVNLVFLVQVNKNEQGLSRINLVGRNLAKVLLKRVGPGFSARAFLER